MNINQQVLLSNPEQLNDKERVTLLVHIQEDFEKFTKDNGGKDEIEEKIKEDRDLLREYNQLRDLSNVAKVAMLINEEVIDDEYLIS